MVTYEMLEAYKAAHKKIISEALSDYSKIESVADDARRAGIEAAITEMEKSIKLQDSIKPFLDKIRHLDQ